MSIKVLFFASLRERVGRGQVTLPVTAALTAQDVWQQSSGAATLPPNVLIAVNQTYATADSVVQSGDEVAFFPPVTGG
jgi:molybdopterin synthase sulfur carrier subunit